MSLLRQFWAALREMPHFYSDKIDQWVIRTHQPLGWEDRAPGEDLGPCTQCRRTWPCRSWSEAWDRLAAGLSR